LQAEQDNLRSILVWSLSGNEIEYGLRLVASLLYYWNYNGLGAEGRRWSELALENSTNAAPALRAGVLLSAGEFAQRMGNFRRGRELIHQALDLYQQLGDERNKAWSMVYQQVDFTEDQDEVQQSIDLCIEGLALFRKLNDKPGLAFAFNSLGEMARLQGDYEGAQRYYEESLTIVLETGERQREAMLLNNMSFVAHRQQNYPLALHYSQRSLIIAREVKSEFRQACFLATTAGPFAALGQPELAARLLGASHARYEAFSMKHMPADQLELDVYEAATRNQLGDQAFEEAWLAGQKLSLQEAVSFALTESAPGETIQ
jgi:tetratricopeptide (TPR) repeat protein